MKTLSIILICAWSLIIFTTVECEESKDGGNYTPEQSKKIEQIRELTSKFLQHDFMKTNGYLARWLRAKNWNVKDTQAALEKSMQWRKENNMNGIVNEKLIPEYVQHPYFTTNGFDRSGQPILEIDMKKLNTRKTTLGGQGKQLQRMFFQIMEMLEHEIYKASSAGKNVSQSIGVYDLKHYSIRIHACLACIPLYLEFVPAFEKNYPGLLAKNIMVNAPRVYGTLLALLKPLMSETTRNSITLYGHRKEEWQPQLLAMISSDQLPVNLGGTRQ